MDGRGLGVRVFALLEMLGQGEGKRERLPGRGNSVSKGGAGTDRTQSFWGAGWQAQDKGEEQTGKARVSVLGFSCGGGWGW